LKSKLLIFGSWAGRTAMQQQFSQVTDVFVMVVQSRYQLLMSFY